MNALPRPLKAATPLQRHLDHLYDTFDRSYLSPDPLETLHRYRDPADAEVFGFYAAGLAYGRVEQILKSLDRLAGMLGPHPGRFVREYRHARDRHAFRGFVHRFHGAQDLALLTEILHRAMDDAGSIGAFFLRGYREEHDDTGETLADFSHRMTSFKGLPRGTGVRAGWVAPDSPVRYFFSSPRRGSACKRLNLYLRWMVRQDPGLDLGLWKDIPPSRLVIPLDTHVARIARYVGLSSRNTPDWKMALEVTRALRQFDPLDPVKYDFAICRLGILDYCPRKRDALKCAACLLKPVCTL